MRALCWNKRTYCRYIMAWKGNHSSFLIYGQRFGVDVTFHLKFALKMTLFENRRLRPVSAYSDSTVRVSEKCSIIANRKSTTRFPTSYIWSVYVTPNSSKGWLNKANLSILWTEFKCNGIKSATKFFVWNLQRQICGRIIHVYNGV